MAVISITITESALQIVAGIPSTILITTNVPSTIFYTLDGSDPTTSSSVSTGTLKLPNNQNTLTFKVFATDGVDTSAVITKSYGTTTVGNRQPHDKITGLSFTSGPGFPFGSQATEGFGTYANTGGITVDAADVAGIPDGYDGSGGVSNETDLPLGDYDFIFSESNALGERGRGIGTLPASVDVIVPPPLEEASVGAGSPDANSGIFNPKSLVIFQDDSKDPYDPDVPHINLTSFNMEDPEKTRSGALLYTGGMDGNTVYGGFLRSHYNPRDNSITYYYRDQNTNRWIISKTAYTPKSPDIANYAKIVFGREEGAGKVFKWIPFRYRKLW